MKRPTQSQRGQVTTVLNLTTLDTVGGGSGFFGESDSWKPAEISNDNDWSTYDGTPILFNPDPGDDFPTTWPTADDFVYPPTQAELDFGF